MKNVRNNFMQRIVSNNGTLLAGVVILSASLFTTTSHADVVVDFEELSLSTESFFAADGSDTTFTSRSLSFNAEWNEMYGCCPSAWSYSNTTDLTTAGFTNSYSAYVKPNGGGAGGSNNFAI